MDPDAFDDFYRESYRRLVGQIYAMCGDWTEAQDCVQSAFIRAWDKRHTLDRQRSPEAWVRTVAYRLAVSRWRRHSKDRREPDRAHGPRSPAEPGPEHVDLTRALAQLPEDQRRAVVMHHLYDIPVADIAAELGAPVGTIKARLSRGRAALAALLADTEVTGGRAL